MEEKMSQLGEREAEVASKFDPLRPLGAYDRLICQGAEGRVFEAKYLSRNAIIKQRFKKTYRHPSLDLKLTKQRLNQEARSLVKARKLGVHCPTLLHVDTEMSCLYLEKVPGQMVKELLYSGELSKEDVDGTMRQIGRAVATLHDGGLVHGDLTTSNMILRPDKQLVMIDFGLSSNSVLAEDKGVDLYVLERAFTSAHSDMEHLFETVLEAYRKTSKNWSSVFNRFSAVRMRGRKRTMVG
mmetsp:Transcript_9820/g.18470  ORF Transcript_9820/g.18470 Transcript_9820/m.18470 type:complete len:240 (+) Transcript_9820:292-1011(+)